MDHTIVDFFTDHTGHRCGYCKAEDTNFHYGMWAHSMTVSSYEGLINLGWRRSGCYVYKPTNSVTCCPMYTISCHALDFKPSKSQKKTLKKFNKELGVNVEPCSEFDDFFNNGFTVKQIRCCDEEEANLLMEHELYQKYQMKIHEDSKEDCELKKFRNFLWRTPLTSSEDSTFGSYHHQYYLKDKLIAVGVVDILPTCLSSVYFFYDPDYSHLSLGTLSALYEIKFVRDKHKTMENFKYYYMGYFIQNCPKMRYKGAFSPSFLKCPETMQWVLLDDKLKKLLDGSKYAKFGDGEPITDNQDLNSILVLYKRTIMPYQLYTRHRRTNDDDALQLYANLVTSEVAKEMLLYRSTTSSS